MRPLLSFLPFIFLITVSAPQLPGQTHIDTAVLITVSLYSVAQEGAAKLTYTRPYSKLTYEPGQGFNQIYRQNGFLYFTGHYRYDEGVNLIKTDSFHYYYQSGQLRDRGLYKDGQRTGTWYHYSEGGTLRYTQNYHSLIRVYYYTNGRKRAEGPMLGEDLEKGYYEFSDLSEHDGQWKFYTEDGTCECEGKVRGNLKHGKWTYYDRSDAALKVRKKRYRRTSNIYRTFLESCAWQ